MYARHGASDSKLAPAKRLRLVGAVTAAGDPVPSASLADAVDAAAPRTTTPSIEAAVVRRKGTHCDFRNGRVPLHEPARVRRLHGLATLEGFLILENRDWGIGIGD